MDFPILCQNDWTVFLNYELKTYAHYTNGKALSIAIAHFQFDKCLALHGNECKSMLLYACLMSCMHLTNEGHCVRPFGGKVSVCVEMRLLYTVWL